MNKEKKKTSKKEITPDEVQPPFELTQKIIDPSTGRDITGSYIKNRLEELEIIANEIIHFSIWRREKNKALEDEIFKEAEEYLMHRIGSGSIGPATAAAGPLLEQKINELYEAFGKKRE